jgi:D-alanine-D-alanine ligase
MDRALKLVVMLGGPGSEREVSLRSGAAVARALRSRGHDVIEIDPQPGKWSLPAKVDAVFLALHGEYGEDGRIQAELENIGVPYTGCNSEVSRIAFDKVLTKERCIQAGVPTARYTVVRSKEASLPTELSLPLVLKPVRQGSSVGLQFLKHPADWTSALAQSLHYDREVLVEEMVQGRETTVGILASKVLPVVEVRPKSGAYDYQNKYTSGATEYFCPAPFSEATTAAIQNAALGAFNAVGGGDYARVDVMITEQEEPIVLEVNTLPGMTETSLLPKAAAAAGFDYAALCEKMIELALDRKK